MAKEQLATIMGNLPTASSTDLTADNSLLIKVGNQMKSLPADKVAKSVDVVELDSNVFYDGEFEEKLEVANAKISNGKIASSNGSYVVYSEVKKDDYVRVFVCGKTGYSSEACFFGEEPSIGDTGEFIYAYEGTDGNWVSNVLYKCPSDGWIGVSIFKTTSRYNAVGVKKQNCRIDDSFTAIREIYGSTPYTINMTNSEWTILELGSGYSNVRFEFKNQWTKSANVTGVLSIYKNGDNENPLYKKSNKGETSSNVPDYVDINGLDATDTLSIKVRGISGQHADFDFINLANKKTLSYLLTEVERLSPSEYSVAGDYDANTSFVLADQKTCGEQAFIVSIESEVEGEPTVEFYYDSTKFSSGKLGGKQTFYLPPCLGRFKNMTMKIVSSSINTANVKKFLITKYVPSNQLNDVYFMAHLGAEFFAPENTMQAYDYAVKAGYGYIVFTLVDSSDGELFCYHNGHSVLSSDGGATLLSLSDNECHSKTASELSTYTVHMKANDGSTEHLCKFDDLLLLARKKGIKLCLSVHGITDNGLATLAGKLKDNKFPIGIKSDSMEYLQSCYNTLTSYGVEVSESVYWIRTTDVDKIKNGITRMSARNFGSSQKYMGILAGTEFTEELKNIAKEKNTLFELESNSDNPNTSYDVVNAEFKKGVIRMFSNISVC